MNNPSIPSKTISPFKRFCVTIGELPTSYLESLSYLEMLQWFCNFLQNNVIPAVNNNASALTEVQNLYTELKNYVDNYFNNLDVQQEIDNKLDAMVTDGTFDSIINQTLFTELNNDIKANEDKITTINSENTIFLGDSYGWQEESWVPIVANLMGLTLNTNAWNFCVSGAGFARANNTYQMALEANESVITNKNDIKNVIICGGANDVNAESQTVIQNAGNTLIQYIKANYPNAKIYVGMIGGFSGQPDGNSIRIKLRDMVLPAYQFLARYGAAYLNGVEFIMKYYSFYKTNDGTHPSSVGASYLAKGIYQAWRNGYTTITTTEYTTRLESNTVYYANIYENQLMFKIIGNITNNLPESSSTGSKTIILGTAGTGYMRYTDKYSMIPCSLLIQYEGNTYAHANGTISINTSGELTLTFYNTFNTNIIAISIINNTYVNSLLNF